MIIEKNWLAYAGVLFFCVAGFAFNGYQFAERDALLYIPMIQKALDPSLFPNDYFFSEPSGHYSLWFPLMTLLAGWVGVEKAFFLGYLASLFLICLAVYHLSLNLFGSRPAAFLSLVFIMAYRFVGGTMTQTMETAFSMRMAALPFVLGFLIPYCRGRLTPCAILAALAFVLHPLMAFPCVCLLGMEAIRQGMRKGWKEPLQAIGLFALVISPLMVKVYLSSQTALRPQDIFVQQSSIWNGIIRLRHSYAFLLNWHSWEWANAILHFLMLACVLLARRRIPGCRKTDAPVWRVMVLVVMLHVTMLLFADMYPVPLIVQMQLARSLILIVHLALVYSAWLLWEGFGLASEMEGNISRISSPGPLDAFEPRMFLVQSMVRLAFVITVLIILMEFYIPLGSWVLILVWSIFLLQARGPHRSLCLTGMCVVVYLMFGLNAFLGQLFPFISAALIGGLILLEGFRLSAKVRGWKMRFMNYGYVLIPLIALAVTVGQVYGIAKTPAGIMEHYRVPGHATVSDFDAVQGWCRDNTPKNSLFIIPAEASGFRIHSQRSPVVEKKDGGPAIFSEQYALDWYARYSDSSEVVPPKESTLLWLARKYKAQYAVTEKDAALDFPMLYQNDEYRVYALNER